MSDKLKAVTDKICELLKGTELDPKKIKIGCVVKMPDDIPLLVLDITEYTVNQDMNIVTVFGNDRTYKYTQRSFGEQCIVGSPIREAEVLMALGKVNYLAFSINGEGEILENEIIEGIADTGYKWVLGKPLDQQSSETIEFLHQIL